VKLIDQTGQPWFHVMSHGAFPTDHDEASPRSRQSMAALTEALAAGDLSPYEDQRRFPPLPGLPREVESLEDWPGEFALVGEARPDPAGGYVFAHVLPLQPRGSQFGARAHEDRRGVWAADGTLVHACGRAVADAAWAGDDLFELTANVGPDGDRYRLALRRPPTFDVRLAAEFTAVHHEDLGGSFAVQLRPLELPRYWEVITNTSDGGAGADLVELGADSIARHYSTPDEHDECVKLTLSPDARRLAYLIWTLDYTDEPEVSNLCATVVAVDLASHAFSCHPLAGSPGRRDFADVTLAFDPAGALRVDVDGHTGTFAWPMPSTLKLDPA
jgi:hypothetical protein